MQDAVNDDAVQFLVIVFMELLGIGADSIQGDDNITVNLVALVVVEGDDIGVVVMSKEFAVY